MDRAFADYQESDLAFPDISGTYQNVTGQGKAFSDVSDSINRLVSENKALKDDLQKMKTTLDGVTSLIGYCSFIVPKEYERKCDLLNMALDFDLRPVVSLVSGELKTDLKVENCIDLLQLAERQKLGELKETANQFLLKHFSEIAPGKLSNLSIDQLQYLLTSDRLAVPNEEDVFQAAIQWVKEDTQNRRCHVADIVHSIRLILCEVKFLKMLKENYLLFNCKEAQEELTIAIDLIRSESEEFKRMKETLKRCKEPAV